MAFTSKAGFLLFTGILLTCVTPGCNQTTTPQTTTAPKPVEEHPGPAPAGQSEPEIVTTDDQADKQIAMSENPLEKMAPKEPETASVSTPVTIKIDSWDGVLSEVQKHKGKVVVVDLWALTCVPCRREFPNLVALQKELGEQVVCMSVNCDYQGLEEKPAASYEASVSKFLTAQNASIMNFLMNVPQSEFFEKIKLNAIPAIYVFKKDGEQSRRFDNSAAEFAEKGFTYHDHVIPLVKELISQP
jgi:thiol-disulfide isomerase/thioredoxin